MKDILEYLLELQKLEMESTKPSTSTKTESQKLRAKIPAPVLSHYDRLRERGKKGVSVVRGGVCGECHMRVPIGLLVDLMHGGDVQLCANCGRYLVLPEDEALRFSTLAAARKPEAQRSKLRTSTHAA